MIGIALGMLQNPESRQDYSGRTEYFEKETGSDNISDSGRSPDDKPPAGKVKSKVKGGMIMLGPIPVIFGSDRESAKTTAILAVILMLLSLLVFRGSLF